MSTQTEAERLADELYSDRWITHGPQWGYDAAAELLRLEADNKALRLKLAAWLGLTGCFWCWLGLAQSQQKRPGFAGKRAFCVTRLESV